MNLPYSEHGQRPGDTPRAGDADMDERPKPDAGVAHAPAQRAPLPGWVGAVALFAVGRLARRHPLLRFASWGLSAWLALREASRSERPAREPGP